MVTKQFWVWPQRAQPSEFAYLLHFVLHVVAAVIRVQESSGPRAHLATERQKPEFESSKYIVQHNFGHEGPNQLAAEEIQENKTSRPAADLGWKTDYLTACVE